MIPVLLVEIRTTPSLMVMDMEPPLQRQPAHCLLDMPPHQEIVTMETAVSLPEHLRSVEMASMTIAMALNQKVAPVPITAVEAQERFNQEYHSVALLEVSSSTAYGSPVVATMERVDLIRSLSVMDHPFLSVLVVEQKWKYPRAMSPAQHFI